MDQGWRTETGAEDYFRNQKKTLSVADRRPVIRKASDLVGPGINSTAVRLDDFDDLLATYNGFYSAESSATNAPTSDENFVGFIVSDSDFGGFQAFTGLSTGFQYRREFLRAPEDPEFLVWGAWYSVYEALRPVGEVTMYFGATAPDGWLICNGSGFSSGEYPELAVLLGGSVLPNFQDRFPLGAGGAHALASTGGQDSINLVHAHFGGSHTHGIDQHSHGTPAHSHSISDDSATIVYNTALEEEAGQRIANTFTHDHGGSTGTSGGGLSTDTDGPTTTTTTSIHATTNAVFTGNAGDPSTEHDEFDILNPFVALHFIIRAAPGIA